MQDLSNRVIKGYELRERVGAGGFGAVYRAYQPAIGREVAIKVILPQHANQPDFIRRFELEAQLIARLEHPHIVPLYDYWRDPDGAYLVMRWLPDSLRDSLRRSSWTVEAAVRLLEQIAGALTVAHREGVIHRDIKPENILLDEDENAYLADFGIAKDLNVGNLTDEGAIVGSPAYITPEQIKGELVTPRSDIYTLGLVMYELLTREKPFPNATTPYELIQKHLTAALPPLNDRQLPAALNEVLQTATAKDPDHRYANVLRFSGAFRAATPIVQRASDQPLIEPLTKRERDILRLMMEGLDNQEIAQKLVLSPGTVKWYVQQIYSKLDVHGRRQAIERARQWNLLIEPGEGMVVVIDFVTSQKTVLKSDTVITPAELVNPYKGLRAFQESDAADFFGRASLTEQLLARLSENDTGAHFLAVVGPSGSGKSSVVKAGLVPALRRGALPNSRGWFLTEMLPGTHPLEELEAALLRVAVNPMPGLLDQLAEDRRGLVRAAKRVLPADQNVELVLVVDQFEELFTLVDDEKVRAHFIDNLLSAATDPRSRVRIILTLRADFYDRPLTYPRLAELVRSHTEAIIPMTAQELERAIAAPAERVGLQLEPGLVETMVNDISKQPGVLPLLQYTLTELFERREGVMMTIDAYRAIGGIAGALARRADELYEGLDSEGQAAARQLFLRLITLGEGTEDTRRRTLQSEVSLLMGNGRSADDMIGVFAQYRLLTFDRDPVTRRPTIEIAHEALIREWKLLHGWIDESRDDVRLQRQLGLATGEWDKANHEASYLLHGARLEQFDKWADTTSLALTADERTYLAASLEEQKRQKALEIERQKREKTLTQRARRVLQGLVGVFLIATVISLGLTIFAFGERSNAEDARATSDANAREAQSLALASRAQLALNEGDSDLAIQFAEAALRISDNDLARRVLDQAAYAPASPRVFQETEDFAPVAVAPQDDDLNFVMIAGFGPGPDFPFGNVMFQGMQDACTLVNATCQWLGTYLPEPDWEQLIVMWNEALALNPDGIGANIGGPPEYVSSYIQSAEQAIDQGIPVIIFNGALGPEYEPLLPALLYVGSDEFVSGRSNARHVFAQAKADGTNIQRGVCAIQVEAPSMLARCAGVESVFDEEGIPLDRIAIDIASVEISAELIDAYFEGSPNTNAIFMLGPDPAAALNLYIQQAGLEPGQLYATTFDTSEEIFQMIQDGYLLQAIDQQPYMQGFQTIISLYLYRQYGVRPSGFINTSSVVDQSNVDNVIQLVEAGYR